MADGTVTTVVYGDTGYGYYVVIDHGNGLQTKYAHASKILVGVGQVVTAGEQIAEVGTTGTSTGNHLHFEVILNNETQDPRYYLP